MFFVILWQKSFSSAWWIFCIIRYWFLLAEFFSFISMTPNFFLIDLLKDNRMNSLSPHYLLINVGEKRGPHISQYFSPLGDGNIINSQFKTMPYFLKWGGFPSFIKSIIEILKKKIMKMKNPAGKNSILYKESKETGAC